MKSFVKEIQKIKSQINKKPLIQVSCLVLAEA